MSTKIEIIQEFEERWICLEHEIFVWIDQLVYKVGMDKKKYSEEIHQVKLRVEKITDQQLNMLYEKLGDEEIDDRVFQRRFENAEMFYGKPMKDFIAQILNEGYLLD